MGAPDVAADRRSPWRLRCGEPLPQSRRPVFRMSRVAESQGGRSALYRLNTRAARTQIKAAEGEFFRRVRPISSAVLKNTSMFTEM